MSRALTVEMPLLPPSVNAQYQRGDDGGVYLTPAARRWKRQMLMVVRAAVNAQDWSAAATTPLAIHVALTHPAIDRWDLDNRAKLLLDVIKGAVDIDDRYVRDLRLSKQPGDEGVIVTVQALEDRDGSV